jgi:hypothetical protein
MEEALISYLLADSGVAALASTRLYWVQAPQNVAKPYATLQRISGLRDTPMDGPSGLVESRVQIDCYAAGTPSSGGYNLAKSLARAIETAISGASFTQGSTHFQGCFLDAERDGYEADATPDKLFRVSLDFLIFHGGA